MYDAQSVIVEATAVKLTGKNDRKLLTHVTNEQINYFNREKRISILVTLRMQHSYFQRLIVSSSLKLSNHRIGNLFDKSAATEHRFPNNPFRNLFLLCSARERWWEERRKRYRYKFTQHFRAVITVADSRTGASLKWCCSAALAYTGRIYREASYIEGCVV